MTARNSYFFKIVLAVTAALLFTFFVMKSAMSFTTAQEEPYQVEIFDVNTPGSLDVQTSGGHITVKGSSTNSVRVEMYVRKNGENLLPEDTDLGEWDIDISQTGNTVKAIAESQSRNWNFFRNNNLSISFVIYTPREMSSNLRTSGGHIEAHALSGNQQIKTSGGHLELANLEGTVEARTSGGHIDITDVLGDLNARTSGGHIEVRNSEGTVKVKTSGGHINLADINGTIEASTSGGGISADLNTIEQHVELKTSGGNVNINIPEQLGVDLNLRGSYVSTNLQNFSGDVERDEVKGKLNGGGPMISARTSGGTVSVSFKNR